MTSVLPKSVDCRELPNNFSSNITCTSNDIMNFDFFSSNRGFLDPESIYVWCSCLVSSLLVDTIINNQTVE